MVIPSTAHISLLASPGLGHLIPMVELAKRLVAHHGLVVTVFAVTTSSNQAEDDILRASASTWPGLFNFVVLPVLVLTQLEPNAALLTRFLAMVSQSIPTLRSLIAGMKFRPTALIVDLFTTHAIKLAEEFNMNKYVFVASNARFLALTSYFPSMERDVNRDKPLCIPGCDPIPADDLLQLTFDHDDRACSEIVQISRDISEMDGILVNTWEDLECKTLSTLRDDGFLKPLVKAPVHPVGPTVRMPRLMGLSKPKANTELIEWLDSKEADSVLYISFGSGGTISSQQTMEIACGLELSKQKFIWVIRPPIENDSCASLLNPIHEHSSPNEFAKYLPPGFMDRTRDVGIVVPMWAPQEEILSHRSVGGFVTHCGWNSVLESIVNGVPMIAWPLYAEQNMNATMLTQELKVAIQPKIRPTKKVVEREEISEMVRRVMVNKEGRDIRMKARELKGSADRALNETGTSFNALSKVAKYCQSSLPCQQIGGFYAEI